jgi:hypothetical protein
MEHRVPMELLVPAHHDVLVDWLQLLMLPNGQARLVLVLEYKPREELTVNITRLDRKVLVMEAEVGVLQKSMAVGVAVFEEEVVEPRA